LTHWQSIDWEWLTVAVKFCRALRPINEASLGANVAKINVSLIRDTIHLLSASNPSVPRVFWIGVLQVNIGLLLTTCKSYTATGLYESVRNLTQPVPKRGTPNNNVG
jgi:hypothetical protein